jgi:hypothetical protein
MRYERDHYHDQIKSIDNHNSWMMMFMPFHPLPGGRAMLEFLNIVLKNATLDWFCLDLLPSYNG